MGSCSPPKATIGQGSAGLGTPRGQVRNAIGGDEEALRKGVALAAQQAGEFKTHQRPHTVTKERKRQSAQRNCAGQFFNECRYVIDGSLLDAPAMPRQFNRLHLDGGWQEMRPVAKDGSRASSIGEAEEAQARSHRSAPLRSRVSKLRNRHKVLPN